MKKTTIAILLAFAMTALLLAGCGSASGGSSSDYAPAAYVEEAYYESYDYDDGDADIPLSFAMTSSNASGGAAQSVTEAAKQDGAKIIYSASVDMETTGFDEAAAKLDALVAELGAYYESSSVSEYGSHLRYGSYTVRVPAENYRAFMDRVGEGCRVTRTNEYTEDVSERYYDTAGRVETQRTKLARLQALLAEAEDMEDIITLESAISETEELIDALSGELRRYDAKVAYSTVTISLDEVVVLSNVETPQAGFGARMASAFRDGWQGFLTGLEVIATVFAYTWMWLLLIGAVVVGIVLLARRGRKRRAMRRAARAAAQPAPQPAVMQPPVRPAPQDDKK